MLVVIERTFSWAINSIRREVSIRSSHSGTHLVYLIVFALFNIYLSQLRSILHDISTRRSRYHVCCFTLCNRRRMGTRQSTRKQYRKGCWRRGGPGLHFWSAGSCSISQGAVEGLRQNQNSRTWSVRRSDCCFG